MRMIPGGLYVIVGLAAAGLASCSAEDPAFIQSAEAERDARTPPGIDSAAERGVSHRSSDAIVAPSQSVPDPQPLFEADGAVAKDGPGSRDGTGEFGEFSDGFTGSEGFDQLGSGFGGEAGQGVESGSDGYGDKEFGDDLSAAEFGSDGLTQEKSFLISTTRETQGRLVVEDSWASQSIVMTEAIESRTQNFSQITRPSLSRTFIQGAEGTGYVETLEQSSAAGVLDLLVVIDNSGSMKEEQQNLSTKLGPLLSYVSDADWRIGVVTTDPSDGCMRALINKGASDASELFSAAIEAGLDGSGNERGIFQAVTGLGCPGTPWLRENSTLAVLIVSDEDNCSDGTACNGNLWGRPDYLLNYLESDLNRQLGVDARVYGLIKHPNDNSCKTAYNDGSQYAQAVAASSGTWGSICASDYSATLNSISMDVSTILKDQFALQALPDPSTVAITLILADGTRVPTTEYLVTGNVVTFASAPPENSRIEVSYSTYDEPQLSQFDLGATPAPGSLSVAVNGDVVAPSAYAVVGSQLVFGAPPAPEAAIAAQFLRNDTLKTSFDLGSGVFAETLDVTINDQIASGYTYDDQTGQLTFSAAPADGAKIVARFSGYAGPVLSYDITSSEAIITDVRAQYADSTAVAISHENGRITLIDASQHRAGETLWVHYRVSNGAGTYVLAQSPLPGTLTLNSSLEECRVGQELTVQGSKIFINCRYAEQLVLTWGYEYAVEPQRSFAFSEITDPDVGYWAVVVDGEHLSPDQFSRTGNTVTLSSGVPLSEGSSVRIFHSAQPI